MFITAKSLTDYKLQCRDGVFGKVEDFLCDNQYWTIRYMVAETGTWLVGREVLISPYAVQKVDVNQESVSLDLTKDQIQNSPILETEQPVSRQFEEDYYGYFSWPSYWNGPFVWGASPTLHGDHATWSAPAGMATGSESHLVRIGDLRQNVFHAVDGEIGHVSDLIIDDSTWEIRYFVIDTRNWWPGKKVLIDPKWIERVSWGEEKVFVNLTQDAIKQSPEYTPESLMRRDYEAELYKHYKRPGYWGNAAKTEEPVGTTK